MAASGPARCLPDLPAGRQQYEDASGRRFAALTISSRIATAVTGSFGIAQLFLGRELWYLAAVNLVSALLFTAVPLLYRFGPTAAATTFVLAAYASTAFLCSQLGTDSGLQFYFVVAAALMVLIIGTDRIALVAVLAALGVGLTMALEWLVPRSTGLQSPLLMHVSFGLTATTASLMVVTVVYSAIRRIDHAERALQQEYDKSEALLANIFPTTVAARLKNRDDNVIADGYDHAAILFADIGGYTQRASDTAPADLVMFLNRLYTDFDRLVDQHRLEKIKTSGDSYMVVSGVPHPRPDYVEALACLALDMAAAVDGLRDHRGRAVPLRIGIAAGPVVAGVVGSRKFFYDVWGDAVNVASRMESTDVEGRIQVPQDVYDRINSSYLFEERGEVDVKGKGLMRTWYLLGRKPAAALPDELTPSGSPI